MSCLRSSPLGGASALHRSTSIEFSRLFLVGACPALVHSASGPVRSDATEAEPNLYGSQPSETVNQT